jgi:hypothetical protein
MNPDNRAQLEYERLKAEAAAAEGSLIARWREWFFVKYGVQPTCSDKTALELAKLEVLFGHLP